MLSLVIKPEKQLLTHKSAQCEHDRQGQSTLQVEPHGGSQD